MRVTSIISILLVATMCLWIAACTTPEPKKVDQTKITEQKPPENPPVMTGSTGQPEPSTVSPEALGQKNPPAVMDLFKEDKTWPPASITPEEKALLAKVVVVFETTKGIIKIRVFPDAAPIHAANFVKLARDGFYNGIKFHRVMADFMSQGGDPQGTGAGGPGYDLPAEIKLTHRVGSVASAMTQNPANKTSGSQFYIVRNAEACKQLDSTFTVFGQLEPDSIKVNDALTITYASGGGPGGHQIPGVTPDKIVTAWVELLP